MNVEPLTLRDCVEGTERSWIREVGWWLTPLGIVAGAAAAMLANWL